MQLCEAEKMLDGILGPKLSAAEEELVTSKRVIFLKHKKWPRRGKWISKNNRVGSRLERHFLSRGLHSSPRLGKLREVRCGSMAAATASIQCLRLCSETVTSF